MINGEPPAWLVGLTEMTRVLALELMESVLLASRRLFDVSSSSHQRLHWVFFLCLFIEAPWFNFPLRTKSSLIYSESDSVHCSSSSYRHGFAAALISRRHSHSLCSWWGSSTFCSLPTVISSDRSVGNFTRCSWNVYWTRKSRCRGLNYWPWRYCCQSEMTQELILHILRQYLAFLLCFRSFSNCWVIQKWPSRFFSRMIFRVFSIRFWCILRSDDRVQDKVLELKQSPELKQWQAAWRKTHIQ